MLRVQEDDLAAVVVGAGHLRRHAQGVGELRLARPELAEGLGDCHGLHAAAQELAANSQEALLRKRGWGMGGGVTI